jgi:hypothetical protein
MPKLAKLEARQCKACMVKADLLEPQFPTMPFLVGAKLTETLSQGVDEDSYSTSSIQSP